MEIGTVESRVQCARTAPRTLRSLAVKQSFDIFLQSGRVCLRRVSLVARDSIDSAGRIDFREASRQDGNKWAFTPSTMS